MYYEKADLKVLKECEEFIVNNKNAKNEYCVYKEALELSAKLIQSLLDSQKEFDEVIRKESDQLSLLDDGPKKDAFIFNFNNKHYSLILDSKAHNILNELNEIQTKNYKRQHSL